MDIGGWQKVSLTDYPNKIATILFTNGCCFRCGFCHNPDLVLPPFRHHISKEEIFEYLHRRQGLLEAVVITGGEPTLQKDLIAFIKKIKELNYSIKLDTCGYFPNRVKEALETGFIDYIAMDIKAPFSKYSEVVGIKVEPNFIKKSIELILNSGIPHEFRSTLVEGLHTKEDILEMASMIKGASAYYLQPFKIASKLVNSEFKTKRAPEHEFLNKIALLSQQYVKKCEVR